MTKIVRFPSPTEGGRKQDSRPGASLIAAKLVTFCSFHQLKLSLMKLAQHPNFETAANAIPTIDWAIRELGSLTVPNEHNFRNLKMLADIINQVGAYVEHTCGYGPGTRDPEKSSSI